MGNSKEQGATPDPEERARDLVNEALGHLPPDLFLPQGPQGSDELQKPQEQTPPNSTSMPEPSSLYRPVVTTPQQPIPPERRTAMMQKRYAHTRRGVLAAGIGLVGLGLSVQVGGDFIINKRVEERRKAAKESWFSVASRMLEGEQFISRQRHTIELFTPGTDEEFLFVGNYVVLNHEQLPSFDISSLWIYNKGTFIPTVSPHEDKHTGIQLISFTGQFGDRVLAVNVATTARMETRQLPMRSAQEHATTKARLSMGSASSIPYLESTLLRITDPTGAVHFVEIADAKRPRDTYTVSTLTNLRKKQNGEQKG